MRKIMMAILHYILQLRRVIKTPWSCFSYYWTGEPTSMRRIMMVTPHYMMQPGRVIQSL